jgi:hypothetical protein
MNKKCWVLVKDEYGNWDWQEVEDEWCQDDEHDYDEEPEDEFWRYPTAHRNESGGWCSPEHGNTCGFHPEHDQDAEDEEAEFWRYPTAHRNESGGWCSPEHGNTCGFHPEHDRRS